MLRFDGRRVTLPSAARALALAVLLASSVVPAEPPAASDARPPAPSAPAPAAPGATPAPGPYAPAVTAPAGATVVPGSLMREQGDFRLREGLRNVPGVGASGR